MAIVGVGLIGGSLGLALRRRNLAKTVVGIGRRAESLATAKSVGAVDRTTTVLVEGVARASLVVVCTPVARIAQDILAAAEAAPAGCLLTDAGSVKGSILQQLEGSGAQTGSKKARFVGSHPLAGSEKSGPQHADADLFANRMVIVTPTARTPPADVEQVAELWTAVGAYVHSMSPEEHDRILAATSHVPHLLASLLASGIPVPWWQFSAGGLRDTTRIAGGDPELWQQILLANAPAVLAHLAQFEQHLAEVRSTIEAADVERLTEILALGKEKRDALGN